MFQSLVADGTLPSGYATDDGAGLLYRGTEMVEALAERDNAGAYRVERGPNNTAVETPLDVRESTEKSSDGIHIPSTEYMTKPWTEPFS